MTGIGALGAGLLGRRQLGGQRPGRLVDDLLERGRPTPASPAPGRSARRRPCRRPAAACRCGRGPRRAGPRCGRPSAPGWRAPRGARATGTGGDDGPPVGGALERDGLGVGPRCPPASDQRTSRTALPVSPERLTEPTLTSTGPVPRPRVTLVNDRRPARRSIPLYDVPGWSSVRADHARAKVSAAAAGRAVLLGLGPLLLPHDTAADPASTTAPAMTGMSTVRRFILTSNSMRPRRPPGMPGRAVDAARVARRAGWLPPIGVDAVAGSGHEEHHAGDTPAHLATPDGRHDHARATRRSSRGRPTAPRRTSYADVGSQAAQLAHALRGLGIDGDQRVGDVHVEQRRAPGQPTSRCRRWARCCTR